MPDLKVCPKCGWYEHTKLRGTKCDLRRADAARALAASVPVPSTQLGYGHGKVTFIFHSDYHLTVDVNPDGSYSIESGFCLGIWALEEVAQLLNAIATTRIGAAPADSHDDALARAFDR